MCILNTFGLYYKYICAVFICPGTVNKKNMLSTTQGF